MADLRFDRYYRYAELTEQLRALQAAYPDLAELSSLGSSHEGRDVWLMTVTCQKTGPASEKPALWIDGNIHASEVSPSAACLYLLKTLLEGYGTREDVTRALDTRAFYICPRVNPDGAEWALADQPKIIRSSTRPHPYDEEAIEGLEQADVDGDGRMLWMRVPDDNGPWKVSAEEPRLLVRREPTEAGGRYYRLLPEGTLRDYDGVTLSVAPRRESLDLNRNFPANWRPEGEQQGAGPYPASEPEVRNVVAFIASHKNITGGITFHTWSGVLLRPYSHKPDEAFAAEDLWTYQKIGAKGTELTGYPNISVFHDFKYHPKQVITGAFDDWLFDHLGVFAWTVEIWSPQAQAGIEGYKFIDWFREHPVEDDLKLLRWSDEKLAGRGYVDWYPFEHPQLGPVELGGWDMLYAWRNPPPEFLEQEVAKFPEWCLWHLLISPKLELHSQEVTPLGEGLCRVRVVVQNTGWLPTYVTKQAEALKAVRGVVSEVALPEGATLAAGKLREVHGQLEGRAYKGSAPGGFTVADATTDRLKLEWVVHAPAGGELGVTVRHERAGVVRCSLALAEASGGEE
jgi:murein tripeptide amidase MpaA